ncbi:helix-turn-helix domain-containing protein [Streptomyces sp. NPDC053427]|uniref:helix-turn-helix transcriptional regulator n=1 Tax=Streptomyces sp. NPDC053427 TaxID=3365701 RepID=UPI0037CDC5F3
MDGPHGASGYRERRSRLAGAVLWTNTMLPSARPVLPDGCTDLIWTEGRLLVAGPDTGPYHPGQGGARPGTLPHGLKGMGGTPVTGLRFAPGQGPAVFGVPAHELRNLRVPLEQLWAPGRVRELAGRVAAEGARALEDAAGARLAEAAPGTATRTAAVAAALARGRPVAEVARSVELGARQLHRLSLDAFGYGPKTLTRVLRFVRALDLARAGMPYAEVAARAGYADQAHLAREVKSLAGAPMGVLLAPG